MKCQSQFVKTMAAIATFTALSLNLSAQGLRGTVKDQAGEPVIGATVIVDGQSKGTVTDIDGNFTINVRPGAKLRISYVGFNTEDITARDGMNVVLKESNSQLDEIVVVGYGSLAKKEISSSIVQVDKSQFNQGAVTDPMELISGKVAGLNVSATADANPNALSSIQVRGASSLQAGNGPLIVIDGIPGVISAIFPLRMLSPSQY